MEESDHEKALVNKGSELKQALKVFGLRFIQMVEKDQRHEMLSFVNDLGMTRLHGLEDGL